jgi:Spy/CpxP family protein refolding chaperone
MKHQRDRRAERLGLTDDQRAKMRQIAFQHREKAIGLQKSLRTEMESVLTPEQKTKAREMKEHHGRRGPGRGERAGPPPAR